MDKARNLSLTFARIALGGIAFMHGLANAFGVMGGPGVEQAAADMAASVSSSQATVATVVAWVELICGLALVLGSFAKTSALLLLALVVAHVIASERYRTFFVRENGFEFLLAIAALCVIVAVHGPGAFCIDVKQLLRRKEK